MRERPDFTKAILGRTKVVDCLLGERPIASRANAWFFGALGFSADLREVLAEGALTGLVTVYVNGRRNLVHLSGWSDIEY